MQGGEWGREADGAIAFQIGRACFQAYDMGLLQLEFGRARMNVEMAKIELERAQLVGPDDIMEASGGEGASPVNLAPPAPTVPGNPGAQPGSRRPNR